MACLRAAVMEAVVAAPARARFSAQAADSTSTSTSIPIRQNLNDPTEVEKLQIFLNQNLGIDLADHGYYDAATIAAVNQFQVKYHIEVLAPWVPLGLPTQFTPTELRLSNDTAVDQPHHVPSAQSSRAGTCRWTRVVSRDSSARNDSLTGQFCNTTPAP